MAPQYKLTYFNSKGLAEPIRYIFAYAKVEYEDERFEADKWAELKDTLGLPFGQVPFLKFDGGYIAQSRAISRYLANEFGLAGKNNLERARCDMLVDGIADIFTALTRYRLETDADKKEVLKAQLLEETLPKAISNFTRLFEENEGSKYFVGENITWADFSIAYGLQVLLGYYPNLLDDHLPLKEFNERICDIPEIKEHMKNRPETQF